MRGSKFCGVAVFCLFGVLSCAPSTPAVLHENVLEALVEGEKRHAPVLLLYAAPWCQACRALGDLVTSPQLARALTSTWVVRVELGDDLSASQAIPAELQPQALGIASVPTLVYLGRLPSLQPEPGSVLQGYVGKKRLADWLESRR